MVCMRSIVLCMLLLLAGQAQSRQVGASKRVRDVQTIGWKRIDQKTNGRRSSLAFQGSPTTAKESPGVHSKPSNATEINEESRTPARQGKSEKPNNIETKTTKTKSFSTRRKGSKDLAIDEFGDEIIANATAPAAAAAAPAAAGVHVLAAKNITGQEPSSSDEDQPSVVAADVAADTVIPSNSTEGDKQPRGDHGVSSNAAVAPSSLSSAERSVEGVLKKKPHIGPTSSITDPVQTIETVSKTTDASVNVSRATSATAEGKGINAAKSSTDADGMAGKAEGANSPIAAHPRSDVEKQIASNSLRETSAEPIPDKHGNSTDAATGHPHTLSEQVSTADKETSARTASSSVNNTGAQKGVQDTAQFDKVHGDVLVAQNSTDSGGGGPMPGLAANGRKSPSSADSSASPASTTAPTVAKDDGKDIKKASVSSGELGDGKSVVSSLTSNGTKVTDKSNGKSSDPTRSKDKLPTRHEVTINKAAAAPNATSDELNISQAAQDLQNSDSPALLPAESPTKKKATAGQLNTKVTKESIVGHKPEADNEEVSADYSDSMARHGVPAEAPAIKEVPVVAVKIKDTSKNSNTRNDSVEESKTSGKDKETISSASTTISDTTKAGADAGATAGMGAAVNDKSSSDAHGVQNGMPTSNKTAMPIRDAAAMSGEDKPDDTEMNDVVAKEIRLGHGLWLQRLMAGEFTRLNAVAALIFGLILAGIAIVVYYRSYMSTPSSASTSTPALSTATKYSKVGSAPEPDADWDSRWDEEKDEAVPKLLVKKPLRSPITTTSRNSGPTSTPSGADDVAEENSKLIGAASQNSGWDDDW